MQNLKIILAQLNTMKRDLKLSKRSKSRIFYQKQIEVLTERINKFGQRYDIVLVIAKYTDEECIIQNKYIFYSDISEQDAIDYTQAFMEVNHKIESITSAIIKPGRLLEPEKLVF